MSCCVALAQMQPMLGRIGDNLKTIEGYIERGLRGKANLIVFPELCLTGYFLADLVSEVAISINSIDIM